MGKTSKKFQTTIATINTYQRIKESIFKSSNNGQTNADDQNEYIKEAFGKGFSPLKGGGEHRRRLGVMVVVVRVKWVRDLE